jgi:hypothetical protein
MSSRSLCGYGWPDIFEKDIACGVGVKATTNAKATAKVKRRGSSLRSE